MRGSGLPQHYGAGSGGQDDVEQAAELAGIQNRHFSDPFGRITDIDVPDHRFITYDLALRELDEQDVVVLATDELERGNEKPRRQRLT